ncbi:MAG: hypothetical protein D6689_03035 [Deltaproteobacteria bacterium]|nr:MAG: hypothetical protein D6689_03035 [Deltaproteobacteria bacterium]
MLARTVGVASEGGDGVVVTSERQRALLQRAAARADAASTLAAAGAAPELVAVELRDAVSAFDELLGDRVDADVLDVLFARFCIGK